MELFLWAEMGLKAAGMDGDRPLPAAEAVFVLHGLLFQAQKSKKGRLRNAADFGVRVRKRLKRGENFCSDGFFSGRRYFLRRGGAEDGFSGLKEAGVRTGEGVLFRLGLTGKQPEPSWRKPGERPD